MRYDVLTVTEKGDKSYWTKVGVGFPQKNGGISIQLEALPVNGKLVLKEADEGRASRGREPSSEGGDDAPF